MCVPGYVRSTTLNGLSEFEHYETYSEDKAQDQLISDSIFWNHKANNQDEVRVFVNYVNKLKAFINKQVCTLGFIEAKIARHHIMFFEFTK